MIGDHMSRGRAVVLGVAGLSLAFASSVAGASPRRVATSPSPSQATFVLTLTAKSTKGLPTTVTPGFHQFVIKTKASRGLQIVRLLGHYKAKTADSDIQAGFQVNGPNDPHLKQWQRFTKNAQIMGGLQPQKGYFVTGSSFWVHLVPGNYVAANTPAGSGADVLTTFTVVGSATGSKPKATGLITPHEYGFGVTVQQGTHMVAIKDTGAQIHMVQIEKIDAGHTEADVIAALESSGPAGPPSWIHDAGFAGLVSSKQTEYTPMHFIPGNYEVLCFMPDIHKGVPHIVLGMHHFFTVH